MGLDCSHDAFHGAYSSFNRFRQFVARAMGGSYPPHKDETLDPNRWYWSDEHEKAPGLAEFFNHSDCDGEISPEMCVQVADALESLIPTAVKLEETEESWGHIARAGGYTETLKQFIAGCRAAAEANEPLLFR